MNYNDIVKTFKTGTACGDMNQIHKKILSPRALEEAEELEKVISSRFRYTGPGKWVKIVKDSTKNI